MRRIQATALGISSPDFLELAFWSTDMATSPISFLDMDIRRSPHEAHRSLREKSPVYFDESCGMYMVLGYDEVRDISADPETFSSVTGLLLVKESEQQEKINAVFEEHGFVPVNTLVVVDPPVHTFHRTLVNKAFNAPALKRMQDAIEGTVARLVDGFIRQGGGDFYSAIAAPLPSFVVADQLGLPTEDFERFRTWTDAVVAEANPDNSEERQLEITRTICELQQYVSKKADEYLESPRPCLLSDIVHADVDGQKLTRQELVSIFTILIAGSHDTTTSVLCSAIYRLARDPELQGRLRADPTILSRFVEEALRYDSPVAGLFRRATKDTMVGDTKIPEGSLLMLRYGAANRDPKMFPDPDTFDPTRSNASRHLSFGHGIHLCIGNLIARAEIRAVVAEMLSRTSSFSLRGGEDGVSWLTNFIVYGPDGIQLDVEPV
ncbi:MAG: cytochrome P450 [Sphingomonadaceae bacterium]